MMPVANGVASTKRQMLIYTLVLLTVSLAPTLLGVTGWIYGAAALVLSGLFIISAVRVMRSDDTRPARAMFGYSIVYLFALLALMIIDKV
jgi:protoheme IX farnesyltransferase